MSKVTIELTDAEESMVGIEVKVIDYDETSPSVGLASLIEEFVDEVSKQIPVTEH